MEQDRTGGCFVETSEKTRRRRKSVRVVELTAALQEYAGIDRQEKENEPAVEEKSSEKMGRNKLDAW